MSIGRTGSVMLWRQRRNWPKLTGSWPKLLQAPTGRMSASLGTLCSGGIWQSSSTPTTLLGMELVAPVLLFSWTGCYIGGHIGGGLARKAVAAPELAPGISFTGNTIGFLGGGQVGCNYQFAPNLVIGIEGDGSAADIKGDATTTVLGITGTAHAKTDWIASLTGRLGWAWDRW